MSPLADRQVDADGQEIQKEKCQQRVDNAEGQHLTPHGTVALKYHLQYVARIICDCPAEPEILALSRVRCLVGAGEPHALPVRTPAEPEILTLSRFRCLVDAGEPYALPVRTRILDLIFDNIQACRRPLLFPLSSPPPFFVIENRIEQAPPAPKQHKRTNRLNANYRCTPTPWPLAATDTLSPAAGILKMTYRSRGRSIFEVIVVSILTEHMMCHEHERALFP